jgi:hypothetical protein
MKWDFSKEEAGAGGGKRYKEGDYLVRVLKKVKAGTSEEKGTPYIEFNFKFLDGKYKGETFSQRFYNSPKALWLMRSFIEAVGGTIPKRASDPRKIAAIVVGNDVIVTLTDNTNPNDNRTRSQVSDVMDPEEFEDEEEDDDELEDDDDEIEEDDDEEEEDEDDEEDEEEEERPRRRRKASSRSAKSSKSRKRRSSSDDDEDDDEEEDDDLDELNLEGL